MKSASVLQWVTTRGNPGRSPTRLMPAGRSVGNPACVWGDPGCGARGNKEIGRKLSPEILIVVDSRINPKLRRRGKADTLDFVEGSNPRWLAAVRRGYHRGLRTRHVSTGRIWELGRSNTFLKRSRSMGAGLEMFQARQRGSRLPLSRAKEERLRGTGRRSGESPRDGVLEVLAERSTDGRASGRIPGRSGRRGSETQATRCREGEVGHSSGGRKQGRDLSPTTLSLELRRIVAWPAFVVGHRVAMLCASVGSSLWLPRNRMSELFTYGSVGGVGGNPGPYPDAAAERHRTPQS